MTATMAMIRAAGVAVLLMCAAGSVHAQAAQESAPVVVTAESAPHPPIIAPPVPLSPFGQPLLVDPTHDISEIVDNDVETEGLTIGGTYHVKPWWTVTGSATYGTLRTDPKWRFRFGTDFAPLDRVSFGVGVRVVSDRSGYDSDGDFIHTAGYTALDLKAVIALTDHISLTLVGNNVLADKYSDGLSAPGDDAPVGRSVRAALWFNY